VFFGAASAVGVWSAMMLVQAWPLTENGLTPDQASGPWTLRLLELAVLIPIIAAGAVAWGCGSLWLRSRAPVRDRRALGPFGTPVVAILVALAVPTVATVAQQVASSLASAVVLLVLAAAALLLMRRAIHVGLLEESDERDLGPAVDCSNCGRPTPTHTFCGHCGVALRALPKRAHDPVLEEQDERPPRRLPPGDHRSRHGRGVVLLAFWLSVGVTCVAAGLVVVIREPSAATSTCPPPQRCPGPPANLPPSRSATWAADAGGHVRLRYPVKVFSVDESTDTVLRLQVRGERPSDVEASLWVTASRQSDEQPEQLVQDRRSALSSTLLGLTPDDDPATAVLQLRVGRFDATGGSYRGTVDTPLGPTRPAYVIIGSAGNGRTAVVFSYVITGTDDISTISQLRQYLSPVLTSVTWGR
jgi:ribosomal protein L32